MNNEIKKNKLGVVSYVIIGIMVSLFIGYFGFSTIDIMKNGAAEAAVFLWIIIFFFLIGYLVYYGVLLLISALIDIKKGKSLAKDITVSIFAAFPIIFSIAMLILLNIK